MSESTLTPNPASASSSAAAAPALALRVNARRAFYLVARGVILETLRRKEFYVLLILAAMFAAAMFVVNTIGIENAATSTLLINLGMSFAWLSAHILTLLAAARQVPNEIESRQIHPLLAKPLDRSTYLLGKWAATSFAGAAALGFLFLISYFPVPRMQTFSAALLVQTLALHVVSLALLAALALLGSLVLPRGVNLALMAMLWMGGDKAAQLLRNHALGGPFEDAARWAAEYIPNFARLNLITRYTDGVGPLAAGEFIGLALHGALFCAVTLLAAWAVFRRRPL